MTEKLPSDSEFYRSILFFFSDEDVFAFIQKFKLDTSSSQILYSTYSFSNDSFIKRFVESLIDIDHLSDSIQRKMLSLKFEEIMLYLTDLHGLDFLHSLIDQKKNQNQKFIQTIENNKLNKLNIKELSFLSNMSVSTFKREFEKQFHSSPSKWFQDRRLEQAAFLLKSKSMRPSDIFEESGYETLSNFVQAFKRKFGITPKQFQKNEL
jgi:AraC family transcriptional regulator, exoenzyme S synthesis regulatory protein ExsA